MKNHKKTCFFNDFFSIDFLKFVQFWLHITAPNHQIVNQLMQAHFLTPLPGGFLSDLIECRFGPTFANVEQKEHAKGQLISKGFFGVIIWTKIATKIL